MLEPMACQAVLLDLDGTLVDTATDLAQAINSMLAELGLEILPQALITSFIGGGARNLVERCLNVNRDKPANTNHALALFKKHYQECNGQNSTLFKGVLEGLKLFQESGLALAVVTNKPAQFTAPLLQSMGLSSFFKVIVSGDTCTTSKPEPEPLLYACGQLGVKPSQSVMIGDSEYDLRAAKAAACPILLVSYSTGEWGDAASWQQGLNKNIETHPLPYLHPDAIVPDLIAAHEWIRTTAL